MKSQVSSEGEVLLSVENLAQMGRLAFPFIDQGKNLGYMREREKEKK
jgi:hypothetical protein